MTGSVVVKDVGALDQFASKLDRLRQQLEQVSREMNGAMGSVSSSWQDPQKDKCEKEIQQLARSIKQFADSAQQQVQYCRRLSQHVRNTPR